jgi:hypothetical protein
MKEKEIKKLWGLSAGRCSHPGCDEPCIRFLTADPTVIGEMAHVIASSPAGPRGVPDGGDNTYENLILLCPTHHTEVDKAPPGTFPPATLLGWKRQHESEVETAFSVSMFSTRRELALHVKRILTENQTTWRMYGPESEAARANPLSNLHLVWSFRKLDTLVPNNRRIIEIVKKNSQLFDQHGYSAACSFVEHAEVFEQSCYKRIENAPRFPKEFEEVIDAYAVAE